MNHDKRTSRNPVTRRAKPAAAPPRSTESVQATGVDTDAFHQSVAGEIAGLTAKATPTTSDQILIEDAADTNSKKRADFPVGVSDHGDLDGLGDDDHDQYLKDKANGGAASEIPVHTHADASEAGTVSHDDLTDVATDDHHARYADAEAVSAMGVEGDANPLNHARYTDAEAVTAVGAHLDPAAIHDDTAGEIHAVTEKATPVDADEILIEDSEGSWAKKRIALTDLLAGGGVTDHGALSGLADDDHSQYLLVNGTRELINVLRFGATSTPQIRMKSVLLPTDDEWRVGNEGETLYVAYSDDSAASLSRRLVFYPAPDGGTGTDGDIVFNDLSGAVALRWDESDGRWEFTARPYSATDSALLEVVGHSHTTMADIGTNTHAAIDTHIANEPAAAIATHTADVDAHHAKYTDAEAATQADTQIAAAAIGDLSDVTEWTDVPSPSYTNLTVGNGTVVYRYIKIGGMVVADFQFTLGSTSSISGSVGVSLPVTAASTITYPYNNVGGTWYESGTAGADRIGVVRLENSTTMRPITINYSTGVVGGVNATNPFTWTTGDVLYMRATYEAA